jgi:hypothetical protein
MLLSFWFYFWIACTHLPRNPVSTGVKQVVLLK